MKAHVIFNPAAGAAKDREGLLQAFKTRLPEAPIQETADAGAAENFAREAALNGCELIVAAGGDGTLNEIVNGLAPHAEQVTILLVPLGTGNDFARTLELPGNVEQCLSLVEKGKPRAVDLVRLTSDVERYFVNVSAGGFSSLVDEKLTPEIKKAWGPLAYVRSAAAALPEVCAYATTLVFDGAESLSNKLYNVVVANGRYVAGGIPIAPEAQIDDGLLDIVLIPESSKAGLAMMAAQIALGKHLTSEAIIFRRAAKVEVSSRPRMWFNVDGELVGKESAVFEILPRALRFMVPAT